MTPAPPPVREAAFSVAEGEICAILPLLSSAPDAARLDATRRLLDIGAKGRGLERITVPVAVAAQMAGLRAVLVAEMDADGVVVRFSTIPMKVRGRVALPAGAA